MTLNLVTTYEAVKHSITPPVCVFCSTNMLGEVHRQLGHLSIRIGASKYAPPDSVYFVSEERFGHWMAYEPEGKQRVPIDFVGINQIVWTEAPLLKTPPPKLNAEPLSTG